jgi:hypothetical protein
MKPCFTLAILLLCIHPIYCQKFIVKDEQTTWNVALTEFNISSSRKDVSYISNVLPSFFLSQFFGIDKHTLTPEEILLLRKKIAADQINSEERNLSLYIKEYDSAYFSNTARRSDIRSKIRDTKRKIKQLREYNLRRIKINNIKDIVFITADEANNPLSFDILNIDKFADEKKFDYIFYGSARQFENIVIVEIRFYSALEKKDIYTASVTSEIDTLFLSFDNVISDITSILLGTPWSKITVNTDSRESDIYLNEKYIGTGSAANILASPGEHTLTIKGPGQEEKTISVFLPRHSTAP